MGFYNCFALCICSETGWDGEKESLSDFALKTPVRNEQQCTNTYETPKQGMSVSILFNRARLKMCIEIFKHCFVGKPLHRWQLWQFDNYNHFAEKRNREEVE